MGKIWENPMRVPSGVHYRVNGARCQTVFGPGQDQATCSVWAGLVCPNGLVCLFCRPWLVASNRHKATRQNLLGWASRRWAFRSWGNRAYEVFVSYEHSPPNDNAQLLPRSACQTIKKPPGPAGVRLATSFRRGPGLAPLQERGHTLNFSCLLPLANCIFM